MGADGSLYVLEWGRDFNYAGSGINPDSGLYRIDYAKGARTPVAARHGRQGLRPDAADRQLLERGLRGRRRRRADVRVGLRRRRRPRPRPNPTHTFNEAGTYNVRLTATDSTGKSGSSTVIINAGNTRPTVDARRAVQGGVFDWGDEIPYSVTVTDPEDGDDRLQPGDGQRRASSTTRAATPTCTRASTQTGCSGTIDAPADVRPREERQHRARPDRQLHRRRRRARLGAARRRVDAPADAEADPGRALHRPAPARRPTPSPTRRAAARSVTPTPASSSTSSRCR